MKEAKVSIIMASSVDGRITLPNYEKVRFTSDEDKQFLLKKRSEYDCIIMGAETVKKGCLPAISKFIKTKAQPINVLVSTGLRFDPSRLEYFRGEGIKRVIFTTSSASDSKIKKLSGFCDIFIVGKDDRGLVDVKEVYKILTKKYKCKKILVEGGGLLNNSFLKKNIADELYLTLCPIVIADRNARSFVEGSGLSKQDVRKLELVDLKKGRFGELFLHYRITKERAKWQKKGSKWRLVD